MFYTNEIFNILDEQKAVKQKAIEKILSSFPKDSRSNVQQLLEIEIALTSLSVEKEKDKEIKLFKEIRKKIFKNAQDLLFVRIASVRGLFILLKAKKLDYYERFSANWLNMTSSDDMENPYAIEQFLGITLDKAYKSLIRGDTLIAYNLFYTAIRQTDSLQAHFEYVSLSQSEKIRSKKVPQFSDAYAYLKDLSLINMLKL